MTNRNLIALLAVLVVAACGGSKKADTTPTADPVAADPVAADPERAITEAECNEVMDHIFAMPAEAEMAENVERMKAGRADMVQQCMSTGKKKDFDCAMAAQTWEQLGQCPPPGEHDGSTDRVEPTAVPPVD